ncbi:hypothetical protein ANN_20723, partial [Periplaneta americana]
MSLSHLSTLKCHRPGPGSNPVSSPNVPEFCPAGVLLHASKSTDMSLSHLSTLKCHRPGPGSNPVCMYVCNVMFYLTTLATAEVISASPEFCPAGVLLHASKSTDMSLSHLSTLKCHRPGRNRTRNLGHRRPVLYQLANQVDCMYVSSPNVPEFCPAGVLLHASKSTDMSLSHLSTLKCHRPGPGSNPVC